MTNREYPKWLYHATENDVVLAADPGVEVELRGRGYRDALTHFRIGVTSDPQITAGIADETTATDGPSLTVSEAPVNPPQIPPSKKAKKR